MSRRESTQVVENARYAFHIVFYEVKTTSLLFTPERFRVEFTKDNLKTQ